MNWLLHIILEIEAPKDPRLYLVYLGVGGLIIIIVYTRFYKKFRGYLMIVLALLLLCLIGLGLYQYINPTRNTVVVKIHTDTLIHKKEKLKRTFQILSIAPVSKLIKEIEAETQWTFSKDRPLQKLEITYSEEGIVMDRYQSRYRYRGGYIILKVNDMFLKKINGASISESHLIGFSTKSELLEFLQRQLEEEIESNFLLIKNEIKNHLNEN